MTEEEKNIEMFKRYINSLEQKLEEYYRIDEEFYKDNIEDLELNIKLARYVLNLIDKKDKVIDLMAEHIFKNSNNLAEYFCNGIPENICEARGNTEEGCRYCIKLYFNKKVEE